MKFEDIEPAVDNTPLISIAEERTREIAARCQTVERACRAIGFRAESSHEKVATLVARLAGEAVLRRTAAEIASERKVDCSERQVRRAIEELIEFDLINVEFEPSPPTRRRGRPSKVLLITLRMDVIRSTVAEANKWEAEHRGEVVQKAPNDFRTCSRHGADKTSAQCGQNAGETRTKPRHFDDHPSYTHNAYASPPPPDKSLTEPSRTATTKSLNRDPDQDWESITDTLRDAGVERVRQLVNEARSQRWTPLELADAAYVVQHTPKLSGGALFDHVRSGGWPVGGVKPAEVIRDQRAKRASQIRCDTRCDAPDGTPEAAIVAIQIRRLCAEGLDDQLTAPEQTNRMALDEFENARCEVI